MIFQKHYVLFLFIYVFKINLVIYEILTDNNTSLSQ